MQHILTCKCGSQPHPMEPTEWHHGYMLSCPNCDEGDYRFGKTPGECIEAWNDWCDERYPAEFTDAMVTRMRRGLMTFEQACQVVEFNKFLHQAALKLDRDRLIDEARD